MNQYDFIMQNIELFGKAWDYAAMNGDGDWWFFDTAPNFDSDLDGWTSSQGVMAVESTLSQFFDFEPDTLSAYDSFINIRNEKERIKNSQDVEVKDSLITRIELD